MKKIAILQSNYIPWKGYFDIIGKVDLFIFHDDLQYTKNDWRNRNKIKTPEGLKWLTIPCGTSEKRLICEVKIDDKNWQESHWQQIKNNYKNAKYFKAYESFFEEIYLGKKWQFLSEMNQYIIKKISKEIFAFTTEFDDSRKFNLKTKKERRVIDLVKQAGGNYYLSGPSAKDYITPENFAEAGIKLEWADYSNYPEYPQLNPPFEHAVTVIDLIFNTGEQAAKYLAPVDRS